VGLGIVLVIVGAIMRFAVQVHTQGFNIHVAGVILFVAGIAALIVGIAAMAVGGYRHSTVQKSIRETPAGQEWTEDRVDSGTRSGL
jgi:membrane-bound ClpP family serine protease